MVNPTAFDVKVPDPSFMDNYDTGNSFVPAPQPKEVVGGKAKFKHFVAQAPAVEKIRTRDAEGHPLKTKDGYFKAVLDGIKLPNEGGYEIYQTHIGTAQYKKYKNGQPTGDLRNASPALDYLHAHGIDSQPSSVEDYENLLQATSERQFEITGDWSAYDSENQTDVAGKWEDFPLVGVIGANGRDYVNTEAAQADGTTVAEVPTDGRRMQFIERNGKRFWARFNVKRYISTVEGK